MIAASARVHPLAVVEDGAVIGENVVVGPFSYVGPKVVLHDDVELLQHAVVTGRTVIGRSCRFFPNSVVGGDPQSLHHDGAETTLTVGEKCTFREGVTVNTGTTEGGGKTVIGSNNLFLANSHVAHDCILGDHIVMSNNVMLAGHVIVEDRVILGGGSAVHQFTRIGRQAFIGGLSAVSYDVIPYGMLNGNPGLLSGLNVVGMARAGIEKATIHEVRRAYKQIFDGEGSIRANAAAIRDDYAGSVPVMQILDFIAAESDRALSSPHRGSKGLTGMAESRPDIRDRLAIIAGGGLLPRYVAEAARARGETPYILALRNEAGDDWSDFDHEVISIGNYAGIGAAFRRHGIGRGGAVGVGAPQAGMARHPCAFAYAAGSSLRRANPAQGGR